MKKNLLFAIAVVAATLMLYSCNLKRSVYKSPDFATKASRHKVIAVLPVRITQTGHIPKGVSQGQIDKSNEQWGGVFQQSLHSYLLVQTSKNKKEQLTTVQPLQKTISVMTENNLTINDLYKKTPEELALLFKVDAVLMTTLEKNKNFSDVVAYGWSAARTIVSAIDKEGTVSNAPLLWMRSDDINMNSYLYDAKDGSLVWKTYRYGGAGLPTDVRRLVEFYSNWIAKKFPYKS